MADMVVRDSNEFCSCQIASVSAVHVLCDSMTSDERGSAGGHLCGLVTEMGLPTEAAAAHTANIFTRLSDMVSFSDVSDIRVRPTTSD